MDNDELIEYAKKGLRSLYLDSELFKTAVNKIRAELNINVEKTKEPFLGEKPRIEDETPEIQRRIQVFRKDYLKENASQHLLEIVEKAKEFQAQFFLQDHSFDVIMRYIVLNYPLVMTDSYSLIMKPFEMIIDLRIRPHISWEEFQAIWKNDVRQLKEMAGIVHLMNQRGPKNLDLAMLFYQEKIKNPKLKRKQLADAVSDIIAKNGRKRQFDVTAVSRFIGDAKKFVEGMRLLKERNDGKKA